MKIPLIHSIDFWTLDILMEGFRNEERYITIFNDIVIDFHLQPIKDNDPDPEPPIRTWRQLTPDCPITYSR